MNLHLSSALASILKLDAGDLSTLVMTAQALLDTGSKDAMPATDREPALLNGTRATSQPPAAFQSTLPSWIHLTDDGIVAVDPELFRSLAFLVRWKPAGLAGIYAASSDGTRAIADLLGEPCYKPGVSGRSRTAERLAEHSRRKYAAYHRVDGRYIEDARFGRWHAAALQVSRARPIGSPVSNGNQVLQTLMPAGLPSLDKPLRDALQHYSLSAFMASEQGRQACEARSLDPRRFARFTARKRNGSIVYEPAVELTIMRPRMDADRLADIIEGIIAIFVMALPR